LSAVAKERGRLEPLLHAETDAEFNGTLQALAAKLGAGDHALVRLCLEVGERQGRWECTWTPTDRVATKGKPR
jgi:predicted secreted protein